MDPRQPNTLDYASPPRKEIFSVPAFVASAVIFGVATVIFMFVIPRSEVVFRDFGMKLPLSTVFMLSAARAFNRGGWVICCCVPVVAGFVAPLTSGLASEDRRRSGKRWLLAAWIIILGLVTFTLAAIGAPMLSLWRAIRGS